MKSFSWNKRYKGFQQSWNVSERARPTTPRPTSPALIEPLKQEFEEYPYNLPTPGTSVGHGSPTILSPPVTNLSFSRSPSPSSDGNSFDASSLDMTQHPAAMLCDLQCQSIAAWLRAIPVHRPRLPCQPLSTPFQPPNSTAPPLPFLMILSSAICSTLLPQVHQKLSSAASLPTTRPSKTLLPTSAMTSPSIPWSTSLIRRSPRRRRTTLT